MSDKLDMSGKPSEFQIIRQYFEGLHAVDAGSVIIPIGDDCAVLDLPVSKQMCISVDTMVEGVHFPKGAPAQKLAIRAASAALSDFAAMGAAPSFFTLSITLPEANPEWLQSFAEGLRYIVDQYGVNLVGGDTTRGPLSITVQVHGYVDDVSLMPRSGACEGDLVLVTGTLGDAGAALALLDRDDQFDEDELKLLDRYYQPTPRFVESRFISAFATSCIDISDGLIADATHVAEASGQAICLQVDCLPLSEGLSRIRREEAYSLALSSGDDYELLITISPEDWQVLSHKPEAERFTLIGRVEGRGENEPPVTLSLHGKPYHLEYKGYRHFG